MLHVKMQQIHKVFGQLSAASTSVQMKVCWIGPPFCFMTATKRLFHCKIVFFIGWSSISFHFCRIAFSSSCSLSLHRFSQWLCVHARQCDITPNQGNSGFSFKRCSWFHQCWSMGTIVTTLTRLEPFRLFCLGHLARTYVWGATWTVCKLTWTAWRKQYDKMERDRWPTYKEGYFAVEKASSMGTNSAQLQLNAC